MSYDLDRLYDDQFIETCAPWVIPYIGDLIGYRSSQRRRPAVDDPRAEVAHTIAFRRRKGTVLVLEELARDVTGWGAHAVEFFQTLGDTQYLNHIRVRNFYAPDMRDWRVGLMSEPRSTHLPQRRRAAIGSRRGRRNIQNMAFLVDAPRLWRLARMPGRGARQRRVWRLCFTSIRSNRCAAVPPRISQGDPIEAAATPTNVSDRLGRRAVSEDLKKGVGAEFYGETGSLVLYRNGGAGRPLSDQRRRSSGADGAGERPLPAPFEFAVDRARALRPEPAGAAAR